jgi:hypothetical protein
MRRLLPLLLLAACAAQDPQPNASSEQEAGQGRVVRQSQFPLGEASGGGSGQLARRSFQGRGMQGWVDESGAWHLSGEVHHDRLRCATYEAGVQFATGGPGCASANWLGQVSYGTRLRHCNAASRLHSGGNSIPGMGGRFASLSCARVVIRCQGTC